MSEESKILLSLEIQGTTEQTKQLEDLKIAIQETRNTLLKLKKESKGGSEEAAAAMVKQEIVLKKLNDEYKEYKGIVQAATEAEKGATKTLNTMRAELVKMKADLDDVQIETAEWTAQASKIKTLSEQIGIAEAKTGSFQRNVGNYANDINRAFAGMGVNTGAFGQIVMGVSQAQSTAAKSAWLWVKGLSGVQKALIATGIGAFIVLLGILAANWDKIIGLFETATTKAKKYAEEQRKVYEKWEDEGKLIDANIRRLELLGAKEKEIAGLKIERYTQELTELDKVLKAEQDLLKIEMAKGDMSRLNLAEKILLYTITLGQAKKVAKDQEEIDRITKSIADMELKRVEIGNQILQITKENNDSAIKLVDSPASPFERWKAAAKAYSEQKEFQESINQLENKSLETLLKKVTANEKISQQMANQQKELDKMTFALPEEEGVEEELPSWAKVISEAVLSEQYAITQMNDQIVVSYKERFAAIDKLLEQEVISEKQAADRRKVLEQDVLNAKLGAAAAGLNTVAQVAGEQTRLGKAAAIASAIISTYQAANMALANPPGPPFSQIYAAAAIVAGLANVSKIIKTPNPNMQPQFAHGVIGLRGAGTGTSDSINAKISKGESVITAKATDRYAPTLAWMEQSVGNKPNIGGYGRRKFARGVIAAGAGSADFGTLQGRQMKEMLAAIGEMRVIVSEKDITNVQNRVKKVNVMGDI